MTGEPVVGNDPFSKDEAPGVQLIIQMRLYDVLIAVLKEMNPQAAANILEHHEAGNIIGFSPSFSGNFIADIVNEDASGEDEDTTGPPS